MKKLGKILTFGFVALMITSCGENKQTAQQAAPALPVSVAIAKIGDIPITLEFNGQVVSDMDVVLKGKVVGSIEKQFFTPGSTVKQGDKLYQIDQAKYRSVYNERLATYKNAKAQYDRAVILRSKNAISAKEFDAASSAYGSAVANLNNAKVDLDYSVVTAPFDGVIGDTLKDVGSYVSTTDNDLVRITKLNPIFVEFGISDTDRLDIDEKSASGQWKQLNSIVEIRLANGSEYNGTISFLDRVIDEKSGTVKAKAKFDNNQTQIRPGVFAAVKVHGFYQKDGFKIPQIAVLQDLVNPFVYVVENGKVSKRAIKIASQDATSVVVSSGLKDGDQVILDNFKKIKDGSPVQVVATKGE
ncbi:efflux RND transporter periplasmic adaptor subunit [Campylobacter lanienae]|uniref:efflux RND transporter periplasmic adaptor subunit n=1 Tax=Campylobacter lanienae TaxID=75658 RepID=UPI000BB43F97|nr:efflux RND transporter periplasmic adaptor subunit [Campylobacter lanienae]